MTDDEQRKVFSRNLCRYISESGRNQREVAKAISVSPQTLNTWTQGIALPRMGKIQLLADYFGIGKMDLIDYPKKDMPFEASETEKELVLAFRKAPAGIQGSVRILLGIQKAP